MDLASLPACAEATQAGFIRRALDAASAAVIAVRRGVNADAVAGDERKHARIAAPVAVADPPGRASAFPTTTIAAAPSLRARPLATTDTGPLVTVWRRSAADIAAGTTVVGVASQIDARVPAQRQPRLARAAHALRAVRRGLGARVATSAAVIGVPLQERARPTAADRALGTQIDAPAVETRRVFQGTRPADVSAGPAVARVAGQIGAREAGRARSTETAGVAVARPTRREAGILSALAGTPAEGLARIAPAGPGGLHPQRTENRTGQRGS